MKIVPWLSQQCLGHANMLSEEAFHERWPFGHLSSYLFCKVASFLLKLMEDWYETGFLLISAAFGTH